ncbi:MAG TPA: ATP-binding protein [Thermomicrobiaceae bacterium]|nr:ATP-binding protein [Thermomicrobiaceae bacterium]
MAALSRLNWRALRPYVLSLLYVAAATVVLLPVRPFLNILDFTLIYLIVITVASLRTTTGPGIFASLVAFVLFDFFFVPPYYTVTVARPDHVLALFVFLGIAVTVTQLVVRLRARTEEALRSGRRTAVLYDLSTALIGEAGLDQMLQAIVDRVSDVFALETCAILLDEDGTLRPRATVGKPLDRSAPNLADVATWVLEKRQPAGIRRTRARIRPPGPPGAQATWNFTQGRRDRDLFLLPVATTQRSLGVLVVARRPGEPPLDDDQVQLLGTFANQAALAIERSLLTEEQNRAEILARSDELKSALLSAVSHDLRTPLASIKASATSLLQPGIAWTEDDRRELLGAIDEETDRLNRLVANLLDLSRIEGGALRPELGWYDLVEAVDAAVERARAPLAGHTLDVTVPDDLPALQFDFVKVVQVLVNLLENAARYSPPGSRITLAAGRRDDAVEVAVSDEGLGVPPGEEQRIFDKFYRVQERNRPPGSGIGLAICRGFVEAHGGRIWAERRADNGLTVRFTLPLRVEGPAPTPVARDTAR